MKAVVETSVIVSALINSNGSPAKILSMILNGNIKILYDNRIIFEYIDVLSRKEFGFSKEIIIDCFKCDGEFINAEYIKTKFSDETEKKFYEVYKSGEAKYLITENIKHFPKKDTILLPKDFLQVYKK